MWYALECINCNVVTDKHISCYFSEYFQKMSNHLRERVTIETGASNSVPFFQDSCYIHASLVSVSLDV